MLIFAVVSHPAMATPWFNMFMTSPIPPDQDLAFIVLDSVFGVMNFNGSAGFFGSCISDTTVDCLDMHNRVIPSPTVYPQPFHMALHQMMQFYSMGIAFTAMLIIIYHVIAIIGEMVVSGTPFGERFNKAWFIPRLIVFFALITPMTIATGAGAPANAGISGAQFITLGVSKIGSNMATNAWENFHTTLTTGGLNMLGDNPSLVALPNIPEVAQLTQFMFVVRTCMYAERVVHEKDVQPYIVREHSDNVTNIKTHTGASEPYNTMGIASPYGPATEDVLDLYNTTLEDAFQFSRYGSITIRFGHYNPPDANPPAPTAANPLGVHDDDWGYVEPTCGELSIPYLGMDPEVVGPLGGGQLGIQENYYLSIMEYLTQDEFADNVAKCVVEATVPYDHNPTCINQSYTLNGFFGGGNPQSKWLLADAAKQTVERYNRLNRKYLGGDYFDETGAYISNSGGGSSNTIQHIKDNYNFALPPEIRDRGWAGAALWYNKIAEINGLVNSALQSMPRPFKYPRVMEVIASQHKEIDKSAGWNDRFSMLLEDGSTVELYHDGDQYIAAALHTVYKFWDEAAPQTTSHQKKTGNPILDFTNTMLGTNGLMDIRDNKGAHPLAMLSAMGKGMVDAALQNLFYGAVGQGIGEIFSEHFLGAMGDIASTFFLKFGMMMLAVGFILYYVLPFMPFIYFMFAFSGWIKSIFEAMVAMPLWALAHIKMDGNGLPGPWATNGYFLLFEIFIRPTLIIFGLVASIDLFSALVDVLHDVFDLVLLNITGSDFEAVMGNSAIHSLSEMRGPLDELFYTVIYAIIVYMMALSSFKLIDQIPANIMRWMGVAVSTFREGSGDPAEELSGRMFRGSQMTHAQLSSMMDQMKGIAGRDRVTDAQVITG